MGIKDQLLKIRENWLLIAIALVVIAFMSFGNLQLPIRQIGFGSGSIRQIGFGSGSVSESKMAASDGSYSNSYRTPQSPGSYGEFAPDVAERKVTKSSSLTSEIETGKFKEAESKLKSIIKSSSSYLLNENVNKYDSGWKSYYSGSYQIKVDSRKYDDVVAQLRDIGEVKSFNENAEDVTASYKNLEIEINAEQQRLLRYNKMYEEATLISDKIQLSDKIFEQERTIKYLQDSLKNIDQRVDYSTIYVALNEKQPKYSSIKFVEFSELVQKLVASVNSLLSLIFAAAPYAVAALILWIAVRFFRRRS